MAKSKTPEEALYAACEDGSVKKIEALLAGGVKVDSRSDRGGAKGRTPMHGAMEGGHIEAVDCLLKHGADINLTSGDGAPPLWQALGGRFGVDSLTDLEEKLVFFQQLIARGAKADSVDGEGETLLHAISGLLPSPEEDDEDEEDDDDGDADDADDSAQDAEHVTGFDAKNSDEAAVWLVGYIMSLGVSIDSKNSAGQTPLHKCMGQNDGQLTNALLRKGAAVDARDGGGATALHAASQLVTAQPLIEAGAEVNAQDEEGNTPLHYRAKYHLEVAQLLVSKGAKLDLKNKEGETPFDRLDGSDREWEALLATAGSVSKRARVHALDDQIVAQPENADLYRQRGDAYLDYQEPRLAGDDYEKAIALGDTSGFAHFGLGKVMVFSGEPAEGLTHLDKALELNPQQDGARLARALTLVELKQYDAAVTACDALATMKLSDANKTVLAEVLTNARAGQKLAALSPVEINEAWYGVKLPAEYREFLENKTYEKYPAHRPKHLPSYGNHPPRISFIYGRNVFGFKNGDGYLDPQSAEQIAQTFRLASDTGEHRVGDYIKQEIFSGLEFDNYDDGYLDNIIPLAVIRDDSQAVAIDISKPGCAVVMYEHETGEFEPVTDTLAEFLAGMRPDDEESDDEESDDEESDGEESDDEGSDDESAD